MGCSLYCVFKKSWWIILELRHLKYFTLFTSMVAEWQGEDKDMSILWFDFLSPFAGWQINVIPLYIYNTWVYIILYGTVFLCFLHLNSMIFYIIIGRLAHVLSVSIFPIDIYSNDYYYNITGVAIRCHCIFLVLTCSYQNTHLSPIHWMGDGCWTDGDPTTWTPTDCQNGGPLSSI